MLYKVFLVEDEIVTREGIRDQVNWKGCGFELCGDAPDGEIALPLLQAAKPDVLITDIRMPFMDGLQLSQIIREQQPNVKIIILSGHDEFEYAQKAIKLGVSDYLLKPLSVRDMHTVLQQVAAQLENEKHAQVQLQLLQQKAAENLALMRERFLLTLLIGGVSSSEAIQKSQLLGIDLTARYYQVVMLKINLSVQAQTVNLDESEQIRQIIVDTAHENPDVFLLNKGLEELVLIFKGNEPEFIEEERNRLLEGIHRQVQLNHSGVTSGVLTIGIGGTKDRIANICQSFVEAVIQPHVSETSAKTNPAKTEWLTMNKHAVEHFLKSGSKAELDSFFNTLIDAWEEKAFGSRFFKDYLLMDVILTTAKFIHDLGGEIDQQVPELNRLGDVLNTNVTQLQIRDEIQRLLANALSFRDGRVGNLRRLVVQQAKEYIDQHFIDPALSLNEVAAHIGHSASHFSMVFSEEASQTFIEYLTDVRIKHAKELLRSSTLKGSEIAAQSGYTDPHYFSAVFKKQTGHTPTEFRMKAKAN